MLKLIKSLFFIFINIFHYTIAASLKFASLTFQITNWSVKICIFANTAWILYLLSSCKIIHKMILGTFLIFNIFICFFTIFAEIILALFAMIKAIIVINIWLSAKITSNQSNKIIRIFSYKFKKVLIWAL